MQVLADAAEESQTIGHLVVRVAPVGMRLALAGAGLVARRDLHPQTRRALVAIPTANCPLALTARRAPHPTEEVAVSTTTHRPTVAPAEKPPVPDGWTLKAMAACLVLVLLREPIEFVLRVLGP